MYRFTGNAPAVLLIDGAPFPVDPQRVYSDVDYVVAARPDLFIRSASTDGGRVAELEAANAALSADLDANVEAVAELLAERHDVPVEAASAAPGEKRTVARRAH